MKLYEKHVKIQALINTSFIPFIFIQISYFYFLKSLTINLNFNLTSSVYNFNISMDLFYKNLLQKISCFRNLLFSRNYEKNHSLQYFIQILNDLFSHIKFKFLLFSVSFNLVNYLFSIILLFSSFNLVNYLFLIILLCSLFKYF